MNKELKELQELKASINQLDKKYRELKGYGPVCCDSPCPAETEDLMYSMCQSIYRYIDNSLNYIYQWQDRHSQGHLPPIQGAGKLQNALETLGISEDYNVEKKTIWAKNRQGNTELVVDLVKKS